MKHRIRIIAFTVDDDGAETPGSTTEIDTLDAEQQDLRMSALTTVVGNPAVVHDALGVLQQTAAHLEKAEPVAAEAKAEHDVEREALKTASGRVRRALAEVLTKGAIGVEPLGVVEGAKG